MMLKILILRTGNPLIPGRIKVTKIFLLNLVKTLPLLFFTAFSLYFLPLTAQDLTPPIENYTSVEYKAGRQNWGIAIDERGLVYVANHKGLLVFDGQRWELLPLKNNAIIRSVYPHNGRIYIGSYQEFGFWEKDTKGKYHYTSLIPLLGEYQMQSEEFWEILSFKGDVYFRSFGAIYKYDGEKVEVVKNVVTNEMAIFKDQLLLAKGNEGLYFLKEDGTLEPLPHQEILFGKTILDIAVRKDGLLIGTRNGIFEYTSEGCRLYGNERLKDLLNKYELNHLMEFSKNELVIGTVKSGIVHYNETSGELQLYNRNKGLQNNTVLGMAHKNGELWLALDNGVDAVDLNYPIRFYRDDSGELGSVYDLAFYRDSLFLASNTGVYKLEEDRLQMIEGAEGHSWNLANHDSVLYSNHNSGTYKVMNGKFIPITERTGSFQIKEPWDQKFFIGTYNGIETYEPATGKVKILNDGRFPVRQMIFEDPTRLWATHAYEGIYKIELNRDRDSILSVRNYDPNKQDSYNARIFQINQQLLAFINGSWYKYNNFQDKLEVFDDLEKMKHHRFLGYHDSFFWFVNEKNNALKITDLKDRELVISPEMLNRRLVTGNERIVQKNDSIFYITLQDGFAEINFPELMRLNNEKAVPVPILQGIQDKVQGNDLDQKAVIPFVDGRELSILAGLPLSGEHDLQYRLTGADKMAGKVEQGKLLFRNLSPGNYRLDLRGVSPQQKHSELVSYEFEILPPWYLSNLMKGLYLLLLLGIAYLIYRLNRLKLKKHRRALEEKYEKEHRENLHKLEKKNLREEITLKRKELANSTLVAAKKNEVLMEIQGELTKGRGNLDGDYRMKQIMKRINRAINNRDDWKVFETNFNEVHEDFFKDLLEKYPELTNKDLKLCSYLKMNLSSKEIAPLLGISVRGVEVQRYRLRKKMGLDAKENLNNFLISRF